MSQPQGLKRSPLHQSHLDLGARIVPFAGWEMPVQYAGILQEHGAVRGSAGVFDISHMGEFFVGGEGASAWLDGILTNRLSKLEAGQGQYSLLCNERGGVIDDLIVYRLQDDTFFLVVNASKVAEDRAWLEGHLDGESGVRLDDRSSQYAALAVQGPDAPRIYAALAPQAALPVLPPRNGVVCSGAFLVCRTGYTGEDGFEFFCPAAEGADWLRRFVEAGAVPCGLGARDSLRLEMGYPLNGADLTPDRTPLEAGLGVFVDLDKVPGFVGSDALRAQKARGIPSRLLAFKMAGKSPPPRPHYPVLVEGEVAGEVTSGGQSPSLGIGIGMAYLPSGIASPGKQIAIDIRGRTFPAQVVKKPLYNRPKPSTP
ncbi:glycine cleavage system aminomethyltransferase GcvT [soil metagenome]